jgi:diguanylate cyclase (GGDEF)-like protein
MVLNSDILGLRFVAPDGKVKLLRPLMSRLLELAEDLLSSTGVRTGSEDPGERLAEWRRSLEEAERIDQIAALGERVVVLCLDAIEHDRRERAATSVELSKMIGLVRDTMASLAGEETVYSAQLTNSATRLEALNDIADVQQLKARLLLEVNELKALATEREARWRAKVADFEERLHVLKEQLSETHTQAMFDPLTGVANRRGIEARFGELRACARHVVLALVDLDGFKSLNDTLGHLVGDEVLTAIARGLRDSVRSVDTVGRLGGDEFVVLMANVTLLQAEPRLRSIMDTVATSVAVVATGAVQNIPPVSASCGVAELSTGDTLASLLKRADEALYHAKRMGKGRVVAREAPFTRDMRAR